MRINWPPLIFGVVLLALYAILQLGTHSPSMTNVDLLYQLPIRNGLVTGGLFSIALSFWQPRE